MGQVGTAPVFPRRESELRVIEPSSVVYEPSTVHDTAYVGHFAIVGHPLRIPPEEYDPATHRAGPWQPSRGSTVGRSAVVSPFCHIDDGTLIGDYVWIGSRCRIGHDTMIDSRAQLYYGCQIFDRVHIGEDATVAGFVCNDAVVGSGGQLFGSLVHRLVDAPPTGADPSPAESEPPPVIGNNVIIGMGSVVVGGIAVGDGAYIGAGAILTTDAEPNTLYVGNPARPVGEAPSPVRASLPAVVDRRTSRR